MTETLAPAERAIMEKGHMSARLLHYSAEPFTGPVYSVPAEKQMVTMKPDGLWVSVEGEDDWPSWCRSEEFALNRLKSVSVIRLRPGASVLWVDSPAGIDRLSQEYGTEPFSHQTSPYVFIDWRRVAERWQAVIIAPYQWSMRLTDRSPWYYSWDCASGCIWDADAIKEVRVLKVATCA